MSTAVIEVTDLSKRFVIRKDKSLKERLVNARRSSQHRDDFWALSDINLTIDSGSTIGLIGPNGSGKSTLLKMIGGILQPTSGNVRLRGRIAALLELGAGFHPDLTGRENVYLNASLQGLTRAETDRSFDAIVDFSGIERFIDTQVKFYSSGMYVRLAFAVAVHVDPDILLVDEVLAVGDEPFQRKCMDRIRGFQHEGRTIVLVSHSLDQVAEICDRAVVLESGKVIADGEPRESLRALRSEFEHVRQEERERHQEAAVTTGEANTERVTVESVEVLDDAGAALTEIAPGATLTIAVTINAKDPLPTAVLGIGIDTPLGVGVFGTNTKLLGVPVPALAGRSRFLFRLPDVRLGDGAYMIHGAVASISGTELHRLPDGASLAVIGDGKSVGHIALRPEFSVDGI